MRIVFVEGVDRSGKIVQENHYYPFGMQQNGNWLKTQTVKNDYLYNGKELNTEIGLNWSDYGARFYDAAVGRWNSVDPLAEKFNEWSPYNYTLNNPIIYVDPDGRSATLIGGIVGGIFGAANAALNNQNILAGATEVAISGAGICFVIDAGLTIAAATVGTGGAAVVIVAAAGAASAVVGDAAGQIVKQVTESGEVTNISTENFAQKATTGLASGVLVGTVAGILAKAAAPIQSVMSKNITQASDELTFIGNSARGNLSSGANQAVINQNVSIAQNQITKRNGRSR